MPRRAATLAALLLLGGCLGHIEVASFPGAQPFAVHPAAAQPVAGRLLAADARRLYYVGIGLYNETWSEKDVLETAASLAQHVDAYRVTPFVLSSAIPGQSPVSPPPTTDNIIAATSEIARRARPGDLALVYLSTHGGPNLLARTRSDGKDEAVGPDELRAWLAPLDGIDTVVILSACFSGSLIPPLQADNRVIIAAARRDRTSFGCKAGANHTLFGQALLDALAEPHESLHTVFDKLRVQIAGMERQMGINRPSEPQLSVGHAVAPLYDATVF